SLNRNCCTGKVCPSRDVCPTGARSGRDHSSVPATRGRAEAESTYPCPRAFFVCGDGHNPDKGTENMKLEIPSIEDFAAARRSGKAMNAIADLGGIRPQAGGDSILSLRERINDDDGKAAATVELAKIGIKIADLNLGALGDRGGDGRKAVGACRRALNQLADAAVLPSVDAAGRKRILAACEWIGAHIASADRQHKLDHKAAFPGGLTKAPARRSAYSGRVTAWHDPTLTITANRNAVSASLSPACSTATAATNASGHRSARGLSALAARWYRRHWLRN